jgi:AAA+ ATPase superfamily predicted ATPase
MFINREEELSSLEQRKKSNKAEFMVIYGRRRVGKTELIDHFIKDKDGIRLLGRIESEKNTLDRFSKDLSDFFSDEFLNQNPLQSWDAFFSYIAEKSKNKRIVLAIDEFPYLIDSNKSIPSILQDHWDRTLKNSDIFLILCGSSIAMMLDKVLGSKSPLYGRRTGQIKVEPMDFFAACKFLKNFKPEELIYAYSILGGTPGYLLEFDDKKTMRENIKDKFLRKDSFLFQDAEFVLKEELKEPKFYFSILRAIALGKTKLSDIMNETGLDKGIVGKYLSVLMDLDIIAREVPVTEKHPHKSRKGIYTLKDNFYKFWFRFVFPNIEEIERKRADYVIDEKIMPDMPQYASYMFEEICREWLWKLDLLRYDKVGRWWDREEEIDIVAFNEKERRILFGECKWQDNVDAEKIIHELKEKAKLVEWYNSGRKEEFILFAKSFKKKFKEGSVHLLELEDLKKEFR